MLWFKALVKFPACVIRGAQTKTGAEDEWGAWPRENPPSLA